MTYAGYVTRITAVRKHPNADRLAIGECFGNTVVVGLDTIDGQLGLYFPSDGRLMPEFLKANDLIARENPDGSHAGGFFNKEGRVKAQKFRKVKSDGFFCPLTFLAYTGATEGDLVSLEGKAFTAINGFLVCEKFITEKTRTAMARDKKYREPAIKYPYFFEHRDTEQLEYNINEIPDGAVLTITEKVHGTSQRTAYTLEVTQPAGIKGAINNLLKRQVFKPSTTYNYICGSRHVVIKDFSKYQGFQKGKERTAREMHHNRFVGKLHKGEAVYYEIVGYFDKDSPIMSECNNKKVMSDKQFTKKYGDKTIFHYGCPCGESDIFVYRMSLITEEGVEIDYDYSTMVRRCNEIGVRAVPLVTTVVYRGCGEPLIDTLKEFLNGEEDKPDSVSSLITQSHIMEGVVVRVNATKWKAYKLKSWAFKIIEQGFKDSGEVDVEESS